MLRAVVAPQLRLPACRCAAQAPTLSVGGSIGAKGSRRWRTVVCASGASSREVVSTPEAPKPFGPYSQAVKARGLVFLAGQLGVDKETLKFVSEDVAEQTDQALKNMGAVLRASGSDFNRVIKTMVLLEDMADFKAMNEVYGKYFTSDPPARTAYAAKTLPLGAKVEIEAIAETD
eukprot:evm.model.scf_1141.3 EVM.evm.TU.scf_1141.3   scf_1141:18343-20684(+)